MKGVKLVSAVAAFFLILVALLFGCGNNVSLTTITVTPNNTSVIHGATQQFTATGTFSDDSTTDLTTSATWSTSNALVSTVSNTTGSQGLAATLIAGTATISATDPSTNVTGYATLNVQ